MSINNSIAALATADKDNVLTVNDSPVVLQVAQASAQTPVTAVVEVPGKGKGGFSEKPSVGEIVEFQVTGLLVVFVVLGGITLLSILMSKILKAVAPDQYHVRPKTAPAKPTAAPVAKPVAAPTQAAAPVVAKTIHPGLSDEKLFAILAVAASEALGKPSAVVKFRSKDSMDWTWSVQGRVGLHTSHQP